MNIHVQFGLICCAFAAFLGTALQGPAPPLIDHHQHLFSPAATALSGATPVSAHDLIRFLDESGIRRAVVLSLAYQFGNPNRPPVDNEYAKVRAENDWTSKEVARFRDRLRGFCSVNPLKEYAIEEVNRCARDPYLRTGLKLHFGNSDVDLGNSQHIAKVREVFRVANASRMAIVVHLHPYTRGRVYGVPQAQSFLDNVLPAAPDVTVQIAHLAGAGGYDNPSVDEVLSVFLEAIAKADVRTSHLYFDVSGVAGLGQWVEKASLVASRIRQLGVQRVLYGSDGTPELLRPRDAWSSFRRLPLSEAEFRAIERNEARYMR
jgi:uncharacterized protein